jgi:DNA polymerase III epsilon subunit family exonuclease
MSESTTPLGQCTFVAFDTETTGIGPGCRLVEIAGARFRGDELLGKFEILIDPEIEMNDEVIAVHQITNEMVRGQAKAKTALMQFFDFCGDAVCVAHNATFDASVVGLELTRNRMPAPANPILDSLKMARRSYPGNSHSLDALVDLLGLPVPPERHRAFADADVVRHLVRKLIDAVGGDAAPYSKLVESNGKCDAFAEFILPFPRLAPELKLLETACRDGSKVNLSIDGGGSRPKQLIVNPRLIYDWKGVVYLEAYVPEERTIKTFRADKLVKAEKGASSGFLF